MQNLITRSISGLIYALIIIGACLWHPLTQSLLAILLGLIGLYEWFNFKKNNLNWNFVLAALLFLTALISNSTLSLDFPPNLYLLSLGISAFLFIIIQAFSGKPDFLNDLAFNTLGIVYIGLPLSLLPLISGSGGTNEPWLLLSIFILIWSSDSFAYLVGRFLGRRRLYERISPNKTWEGLIGGAIFTLSGSFLLFYFIEILSLVEWLGLAMVVIVFGTIGDLFESSIKRTLGIKDSGSFIPGHGGILDRIDSLLFALPFSYFYLLIVTG